METKLPATLTLRIDWSEIDIFNHVNNVAFMKYVQASRVNYWELVGIAAMHQATNVGPMLASTQCSFKKPLYYPGSVQIKAGVSFIKNTSFGIYHQLFNSDGELAAEANDVMVLFDFNKNIKEPLPSKIKEAIENFEGRKY